MLFFSQLQVKGPANDNCCSLIDRTISKCLCPTLAQSSAYEIKNSYSSFCVSYRSCKNYTFSQGTTSKCFAVTQRHHENKSLLHPPDGVQTLTNSSTPAVTCYRHYRNQLQTTYLSWPFAGGLLLLWIPGNLIASTNTLSNMKHSATFNIIKCIVTVSTNYVIVPVFCQIPFTRHCIIHGCENWVMSFHLEFHLLHRKDESNSFVYRQSGLHQSVMVLISNRINTC